MFRWRHLSKVIYLITSKTRSFKIPPYWRVFKFYDSDIEWDSLLWDVYIISSMCFDYQSKLVFSTSGFINQKSKLYNKSNYVYILCTCGDIWWIPRDSSKKQVEWLTPDSYSGPVHLFTQTRWLSSSNDVEKDLCLFNFIKLRKKWWSKNIGKNFKKCSFSKLLPPPPHYHRFDILMH